MSYTPRTPTEWTDRLGNYIGNAEGILIDILNKLGANQRPEVTFIEIEVDITTGVADLSALEGKTVLFYTGIKSAGGNIDAGADVYQAATTITASNFGKHMLYMGGILAFTGQAVKYDPFPAGISMEFAPGFYTQLNFFTID